MKTESIQLYVSISHLSILRLELPISCIWQHLFCLDLWKRKLKVIFGPLDQVMGRQGLHLALVTCLPNMSHFAFSLTKALLGGAWHVQLIPEVRLASPFNSFACWGQLQLWVVLQKETTSILWSDGIVRLHRAFILQMIWVWTRKLQYLVYGTTVCLLWKVWWFILPDYWRTIRQMLLVSFSFHVQIWLALSYMDVSTAS